MWFNISRDLLLNRRQNTMRRVGIILIALWLVGCATQPAQTKIAAGTRMTLQGVAFISPNEPGWSVHQTPDSNDVEFGRILSNQDTEVMRVIVTQLPSASNDKEVFADFQANLDKRAPKPRFDVVMTNYTPETFKQAACLKYDVIIDDHKVNKYIVMTGYGCRHPQDPLLFVEFEVSQRSQSQMLSPSLTALGKTFFEHVEFLSPVK
jgi:hypothetical protein